MRFYWKSKVRCGGHCKLPVYSCSVDVNHKIFWRQVPPSIPLTPTYHFMHPLITSLLLILYLFPLFCIPFPSPLTYNLYHSCALSSCTAYSPSSYMSHNPPPLLLALQPQPLPSHHPLTLSPPLPPSPDTVTLQFSCSPWLLTCTVFWGFITHFIQSDPGVCPWFTC